MQWYLYNQLPNVFKFTETPYKLFISHSDLHSGNLLDKLPKFDIVICMTAIAIVIHYKCIMAIIKYHDKYGNLENS
jgi:hypothetical protein